MPPLRHQIIRLLVATIAALVFAGEIARAQDDGEVEEAAKADRRVREERAYFKQERKKQLHTWIAGRFGEGAQPLDSLEKNLASRIRELQDVCHLTEAQAKKLDLAGHGDIKRFLDRLESIAKRLTDVDNHDFEGLSRETHAFEQDQDRLFDRGSLFSKTTVTALSPKQLADRISARYRSAVSDTVHRLASLTEMNDTQCEQLVTLLLTETKPPREFGRSDYAFVMFQCSRLPEVRLRKIFQEAQWKTLQQQFASWADSGNILKTEGFVFDNGPQVDRPPTVQPVADTPRSKN